MNDSRGWRQAGGLPDVFYTSIAGTSLNDVVCIGSYGTVAHYNGSSWHVFTELANNIWNLQSAAVNNDLIAVAGGETISIGGRGVVAIGKRIN